MISKQALNLVGCSLEDYQTWCRKNNKVSYKMETKKEFFARINDGRLVRNAETGELVNKHSKEENEEN